MASQLAFITETSRLNTFQRGWTGLVSPESLARSGFYYTGVDDKVKCYVCQVEISQWNESDSADVEHRSNSPNCALLNGSYLINVPLGVTIRDMYTNGVYFKNDKTLKQLGFRNAVSLT
jgi:hypothetical protein